MCASQRTAHLITTEVGSRAFISGQSATGWGYHHSCQGYRHLMPPRRMDHKRLERLRHHTGMYCTVSRDVVQEELVKRLTIYIDNIDKAWSTNYLWQLCLQLCNFISAHYGSVCMSTLHDFIPCPPPYFYSFCAKVRLSTVQCLRKTCR